MKGKKSVVWLLRKMQMTIGESWILWEVKELQIAMISNCFWHISKHLNDNVSY